MKDTQECWRCCSRLITSSYRAHHNLTPTVWQRFKRGDFVKVKVLKLDQQKRRVCEPLSCELIHTDYSHRRPWIVWIQVSLGMKPSLFADESGEDFQEAGVASARMTVDSSSEHDEGEVSMLMRRDGLLASKLVDSLVSHSLKLAKAKKHITLHLTLHLWSRCSHATDLWNRKKSTLPNDDAEEQESNIDEEESDNCSVVCTVLFIYCRVLNNYTYVLFTYEIVLFK